MENLLFSFY